MGGLARYIPFTTVEPAPLTMRFMLATVDKPRNPRRLRDIEVAIAAPDVFFVFFFFFFRCDNN